MMTHGHICHDVSYHEVDSISMFTKYDRSSIMLRIIPPSQHPDQNYGICQIFSLFVVYTVVCTTFSLWGKRHTENQNFPTPHLNAFVYIVVKS